MARRQHRPPATKQALLEPQLTLCWECGERMWAAYLTERTVTTLQGVCHLTLKIRRCHNQTCLRSHCAYRPEEEGRWALPHGEFGLDVIALVGSLRSISHRSVPEIHQTLCDRGISIAERTVTHLLQRYEEVVTLKLADQQRLRERFKEQGQVILALDGLQPDGGHEVLWVLRACLSGEVLLARSLLSACEVDLARLLCEVKQAVDVPIRGVISDGQRSMATHTNNELEQYFGSARHYERRATGRKQASPDLVVRGVARVVASVASRLHPFSGPELRPTNLTRWRTLRSELNHRHEARRMQYRFRQ